MIAILLPDLRCGGVERLSLDLAYEFRRAGHKVEFALMSARGEFLSEAQAAFEITDLGCARLRSLPLRLRRYLLQRRPDALLAAMWPLTGIAALTLSSTPLSTQLVVSEHSDFGEAPWLKPMERQVLKTFGRVIYSRARKVIAVSRGVSESLQRHIGLKPTDIDVVYNPIRPLNEAQPEKRDKDLLEWWDEASLKLIAVGSLKAAKDYPTLLRAMSLLKERIDARLIIIGEGSERTSLEMLIEAEGLSNVKLMGFRDLPYPYLQLADVFVLSSRWEGLGNVITEALLCGCRVVATNCRSGPAELLDDGRFGMLVPVGDPHGLASSIQDIALAEHNPAPGRAWASRFSPRSAAKAYLRYLAPR